MASDIKCPACGNKFPIEQAVSEEYAKELREKMISFIKKKEEEYQRKMEELSRQSHLQQAAFDHKLLEEKKNSAKRRRKYPEKYYGRF